MSCLANDNKKVHSWIKKFFSSLTDRMPYLNDPKWTKEEIGFKTKIFFSFVFLVLIILAFFYMYSTIDYGVVIGCKRTIRTLHDYNIEYTHRYPDLISIAQWIIVISLASIVWMWRKKFGITGFIGIQGKHPKEEQYVDDDQVTEAFKKEINQALAKIKKDEEKNGGQLKSEAFLSGKTSKDATKGSLEIKTPQISVPVTSTNIPSQNLDPSQSFKQAKPTVQVSSQDGLKASSLKYLTLIQKILSQYPALSILKLAKLLSLTTPEVDKIVSKRPNLFRKKGKGDHAIVSYIKSDENTAIENYKEKFISDAIVSEKRHIKVDSYPLDGIVKTETDVYLFETVREINETRISDKILVLISIAKRYGKYNGHVIIIIVGDKPVDTKALQRIRNKIKQGFNKFGVKIQIVPDSKDAI